MKRDSMYYFSHMKAVKYLILIIIFLFSIAFPISGIADSINSSLTTLKNSLNKQIHTLIDVYEIDIELDKTPLTEDIKDILIDLQSVDTPNEFYKLEAEWFEIEADILNNFKDKPSSIENKENIIKEYQSWFTELETHASKIEDDAKKMELNENLKKAKNMLQDFADDPSLIGNQYFSEDNPLFNILSDIENSIYEVFPEISFQKNKTALNNWVESELAWMKHEIENGYRTILERYLPELQDKKKSLESIDTMKDLESFEKSFQAFTQKMNFLYETYNLESWINEMQQWLKDQDFSTTEQKKHTEKILKNLAQVQTQLKNINEEQGYEVFEDIYSKLETIQNEIYEIYTSLEVSSKSVEDMLQEQQLDYISWIHETRTWINELHIKDEIIKEKSNLLLAKLDEVENAIQDNGDESEIYMALQESDTLAEEIFKASYYDPTLEEMQSADREWMESTIKWIEKSGYITDTSSIQEYILEAENLKEKVENSESKEEILEIENEIITFIEKLPSPPEEETYKLWFQDIQKLIENNEIPTETKTLLYESWEKANSLFKSLHDTEDKEMALNEIEVILIEIETILEMYSVNNLDDIKDDLTLWAEYIYDFLIDAESLGINTDDLQNEINSILDFIDDIETEQEAKEVYEALFKTDQEIQTLF